MKQVYVPPTVTMHGTIQQITQHNMRGDFPDGGGEWRRRPRGGGGT